MKICFVTTSSISIDSFIMPTFAALLEMGFEVSVVTCCLPGFKDRCNKTVKIHDYRVGRGFDFLGTIKSVFRFRTLCKKEKFDIVAYATPNGALYGALGSWLAGVPNRVLLQWGMRYVGFSGLMRKFIFTIEKFECHLSTNIRNVSEKNRLIAINEGMYRPEKCKVLGKGGTVGVDLEIYGLDKKKDYRREIRQKYKLDNDALVYGFVGRVCVDKGVRELFGAFEEVAKTNPHALLMVIGGVDDNSGLTPDELERVKNNAKILLVGMIPNQEVVKYLSACDVLVHPTYREGFGMVLQEAAALEIPTITTNIPGASEAIVDGVTGLLAEKEDIPTLVDAMTKMFDEKMRNQFGKAGRLRVENFFERSVMVKRICEDYLEIYRSNKQQ